MKKIMITMLVAAMATTSFAQDIAKQMKGQSYTDAKATLNAALSGLSAEQKAKGYNQLVEIEYPKASEAYDAIQLAAMQKTKANVDYTIFANCLNDAVKCDEFDSQPNDKGKVSPKFRKKNGERLASFRTMLINAANETDDVDLKLALSNAYINSSNSPVFAEALKGGDQYIGYAEFFAAAANYNKGNWKECYQHAEKAIPNPDVTEQAESYFSSAYLKSLQTRQDTLDYIKAMQRVNPVKFLPTIASMYSSLGETEKAEQMLDDAIHNDPNNKMAYAIKGENAMNAKNYDEAIKYFKKTVAIDPKFTAVWFNIGVCASSKGYDLSEKCTVKGKISPDDQAKVNECLKEAETAYEKVRDLDPDRQTISNWPYQLRMIYNALGETDKAAEISKMLGE